MRFKTFFLFGALSLVGCADSRELCGDIELGTPARELPLTTPSIHYRSLNMGERKGPGKALMCCGNCDWGAGNCESCESRYQVDCADPSFRATFHDVGGDYSDRCGSSSVPGKYACTAWVRDEKVVATMGFCFD